MEVAILEMPIDQNYKVRLDGEHLAGFIRREVVDDGPDAWSVTMEYDGVERQLKRECTTREAAAFLMLHHHFELQVRGIRKEQADADS